MCECEQEEHSDFWIELNVTARQGSLRYTDGIWGDLGMLTVSWGVWSREHLHTVR